MHRTTARCIPHTRNRRRVAGWSEKVQPYKERSIFWHKLWIDNGKTRQGVIYQIMLKSRADYKRISRQVIRSQHNLKMERMADCILSNNQRKFWDEVRKVSHKKSMANPNNVDGVQCEMNVGSLFRQKYETLYQSVPYNKEDMKRIICEVDNGVNNVCNNHECTNNHDITVNGSQCAIKKIRLFKSDACFELFSNNLIYGGNSLYVHISLLFNSMLKHGVTPDNMSLSTLIPIPKSFKRSRNDSNNDRAIALGSVFGKVLDHVILNQNINEMSSCDLQFGFKSKHSTTQCTYVLQEIIDMYTRNKASLYIILLDASQAFDRVDYCKLFELLISRNICNCTVRLLINMYASQSLRVKWGDTITDGFTCQNGVKQGGVISPILFCIHIWMFYC